MRGVLLSIAVVVVACLPLVVLTGLGARARGWPPAGAVLAGLGFPLTWVVWYVADERPRRARDR